MKKDPKINNSPINNKPKSVSDKRLSNKIKPKECCNTIRWKSSWHQKPRCNLRKLCVSSNKPSNRDNYKLKSKKLRKYAQAMFQYKNSMKINEQILYEDLEKPYASATKYETTAYLSKMLYPLNVQIKPKKVRIFQGI